MAGDYMGPHSGYTFDGIVRSVEFWADSVKAAALLDAAALLREQAAELERLRAVVERMPAPHDECPLAEDDR